MVLSQGLNYKGGILIIGNEPASLKLLFTILTEDDYAVDVRKPGTDGSSSYAQISR